MSTNPTSSQNIIFSWRKTVSWMYRFTKKRWQTLPISSTTLVTLMGGASTTSPLMLLIRCWRSKYLMRQFPPKLVPTRKIQDSGQYVATLQKAASSSPYFMAVKGMGLVISLLMPRLFKQTQQYPSSEAGFISSLIQFISLPPVSPCMTNKTGGFLLSRAGGSQSREIWPPSSKKIFSLLNWNGNRGSLILKTDWRKGCARQGVGRQCGKEEAAVEGEEGATGLREKSLARFFIFILFIIQVYSLGSYQRTYRQEGGWVGEAGEGQERFGGGTEFVHVDEYSPTSEHSLSYSSNDHYHPSFTPNTPTPSLLLNPLPPNSPNFHGTLPSKLNLNLQSKLLEF